MNKYLGTCQIVHIPEKEPYSLDQQPTENVFASVIDPKNANAILRRLNQIAPLENLHHVKRIQKKTVKGIFDGQTQLSVILCLASEGNHQLNHVPTLMQELISSYQLIPFITKVCKYAATSKEEWLEQCKFWPTSYHPKTYNIDGINGFSDMDSKLVLKFMQSALELAKFVDGLVVNSAVIVDPSAGQVISSARDEVFTWNTCKDDSKKPDSSVFHPIISDRIAHDVPLLLSGSSNQYKEPYTGVACLYPWRWAELQLPEQGSYYSHPLRHAAIVAIESSAARDRHLFPTVENIEEKCFDLDCNISPPPPPPTASPTMRKRMVCENVEDDEKLNPHSQSFHQVSERPYLCTGYDIYLVWEPCTMCAMALVHQRIRRIFYAFPNPHVGALGSVHRLQGEKSLNHHYAVFRVLLPEEVPHECNVECAETTVPYS